MMKVRIGIDYRLRLVIGHQEQNRRLGLQVTGKREKHLMVEESRLSTHFFVFCLAIVLLLKTHCLLAAHIEDDPLYIVLDECALDYVNFRVKSQAVVLKAEHYVHEVKGLRKTFYDGQVTKELQWASFYLEVFQQLEFESDFMTFLSEETNKRLELGVYASIKEHDEKNILNVFVTHLVTDKFSLGRQPRFAEGRPKSGQIPQMDEYVQSFMLNRIGGHQVIQRARSLIDNLSPQRRKKCKLAMYYIYVLDGLEKLGPVFLREENERVEKLLGLPYQHAQANLYLNGKSKILQMFNRLLQRKNNEVRKYKDLVQNGRGYPAEMYAYLSIALFSGSWFLYITFCTSENSTPRSPVRVRRNREALLRQRKPSSPRRRRENKFGT